jgi:hypothetical protein
VLIVSHEAKSLKKRNNDLNQDNSSDSFFEDLDFYNSPDSQQGMQEDWLLSEEIGSAHSDEDFNDENPSNSRRRRRRSPDNAIREFMKLRENLNKKKAQNADKN